MAAERLSTEELHRLIRVARDETRPRSERDAARNAVVMDSRGLAVALARRYAGEGVRDDAEQAGVLGLMEAVRKYDPGSGYEFGALAAVCVRRAVLRERCVCRVRVTVPRYLIADRKRLERAGLTADAPAELIARTIGVGLKRARLLKHAASVQGRGWVSEATAGFVLPAAADPAPAETPADVRLLRQGLAVLTPRERKTVLLHHGLDGGSPMRLEDVGRRTGDSRSMAQVRLVAATAKLRGYVAGEPPAETPMAVKHWTPDPRRPPVARPSYSLTQARELLRVKEGTVREWLRNGVIRGERGTVWSVAHADLMAFLSARPEFAGLAEILDRQTSQQDVGAA